MTRHEDSVRLRHMLDYAREAILATRGKNRDDLMGDRVLQLAVTRLAEIVGEAANRVSRQNREQIPAIPWPQIIGLRNRLVNGYVDVDLNILWNIVQDDLPPLIDALEAYLGKEL